MLEYITLGLVILKYALDYIAPKTKNKVDDKMRDAAAKLPLPDLHTAAHKAADKFSEKPATTNVTRGFTPHDGSRDHRAPKS